MSDSYLHDSGKKSTGSKGDLAIFDKVMRGVMNEENERLCAMGMASINQDGTTSSPAITAGRNSPEHQWETPTLLPSRMTSKNNEEFEMEVGIESEYHDYGDDEVIHRHHNYASRLSTSPTRASAATTRATVTAPKNNKVASSGSRSPSSSNSSNGRRTNKQKSDENDFAMTTFSQWSSSYFR